MTLHLKSEKLDKHTHMDYVVNEPHKLIMFEG